MIRQAKNTFVALVMVLTLAACASQDAKGSGMEVSTVNATCPMMSDHDVDPDVTVDYKGHKVGFCCTKCVGKWNEWSDEKKAGYIENSMAAKK